MRHRVSARLIGLLAWVAIGAAGWECSAAEGEGTDAPAPPFTKDTQEVVRVGQLIQGRAISRHYPYALPTLLKHVAEKTSVNVVPEPVIIESFEDERIFECPYIYANFADRSDWTFSERERTQLKGYLSRGGFLFIDAGINAEFLRENAELGQHHSFGEWEACPQLKEAFAAVFPGKAFRPLQRSHPIFRIHHSGLPDPKILPETVREFVVNEKWPDGTYSAVGLKVEGRIAVLVTPIIAMGWGRNTLGNWRTRIRFRVRETTQGLSDYLRTAAYSGARFEVVREDAGKDVIYCQKFALPAWANEPDGEWRVFRYYGSREISDFAHVFYTRLGVNFLLYSLTH